MKPASQSQPASEHATAPRSLSWPFAGGKVCDIGMGGTYVEGILDPAEPDEVVARVDAVCVCSSDVKIIRMGVKHPLFNARDLATAPVILGHEMAITVIDVGRNWQGRYQAGQRLGVQPAMMIKGRRATVGIDLPGGFSQHIRLDGRMLNDANPYVFPLPEGLSAASGAMLEPYSCVEAAYRPNCRISLKAGGTLLIVGRADGGDATLRLDVAVDRTVLVDAPPALAEWARNHSAEVVTAETLESAVEGRTFDDIILCGAVTPSDCALLLPNLANEGLFALVSQAADATPVPVDVARIHYHALSLVGAPGPTVEAAFDPARNRFDFRSGGTALILGAGGAMGRIHTHRALDLADGPGTIIATSRKGLRCEALERDFGPLARERGKTLIVVENDKLEALLRDRAPEGCDDVVVVAPDVTTVERGARLMRADGMLVVFSGMPFDQPCTLPLGLIASRGARFTGSTGSLVEDQLAVLHRVTDHGLDLTGNLEAVAGFAALPEVLEAVMEGRVCGKVAIYPATLTMPLTSVRDLKRDAADKTWTVTDEARLIGA